MPGSELTNGRRAERGNALVLAVLILLTLTAVGVVSMQRTNMDLRVAGNITRAVQAGMAGEAGLSFGLGEVGANPHRYLNLIEVRKATAAANPTAADDNFNLSATVAQRSTALSAADQANRISHVAHDTAARLRQDIAYEVTVVFINEFKAGQGSSTDVDICFERFVFNTRGGIPTKFPETVDETLDQTDTVVVRGRAEAVVGEVKCKMLH